MCRVTMMSSIFPYSDSMQDATHCIVQVALCDNACVTKPAEVPLPLTHAVLLDAARRKFKTVSKQSRLFDGVSGSEIEVGCTNVQLASGAKVVCSGKAGWKGAERLRAALLNAGVPAMGTESEEMKALSLIHI